MKSVMFVDDDRNVLSGLERMLYRLRSSWNIHYAASGEEALDIVRQADRIDVVVTDLHMPGMHGAEFLKRVAEIDPQIIRIVLSGNLNPADLTEAANVAHQILAKPCDPDHLRNVLSRAFTLRERMENSPVKESLMQMGTLPSVPVLYWRIMEEINSPKPSIERVAEMISKDPGMTAKVLKIANSATSPDNRISNIIYATHSLGLENLRSFVLVAELFDNVTSAELAEMFDVEALWQHGLNVGEYAQTIAEFEGAEKHIVEASYTAGLLHDIGLLILGSKLPDDFAAVLRYASENGATLVQAERKVLKVTHAEVGAYLLDLWGLSDNIVKAISHHFFPAGDEQELYTFEEDEAFSPLTAVHAANFFCEDQERTTDEYGRAELDMNYLESLGLGDHVPNWWDLCTEEALV